MKQLLDKLNKENKLAAVLMCLFVCVWLVIFLTGTDTAAVETVGILSEEQPEEGGNGFLDELWGAAEQKSESGQETEDESGTEAAAETESETEAETETETETETEGFSLEEAAAATRIIGTGMSVQARILRSRLWLAQLGSGFHAPLRMPEVFGLQIWKGRYDCGALLLSYGVLPAEQASDTESARILEDLEEQLRAELAEYDGEWSVYVKNLSTDESFVLNDQPMKSASVMKLFIMGTVYTEIAKGELERTDELMSLMNNMIINSDNSSSNQILSILGNGSYETGIARVDAFIDAYDFSDMTVEYNGFSDPATVVDSESYNQVAARDCGKLLEDIYRRTWVNREVSNEIEEMLLSQSTRYKIPAGLPEGVLCGNKTGEMDSTENDAAIIYTDSCDYILVVLSSDWSSRDTAVSRIQSISAMVYEFLA